MYQYVRIGQRCQAERTPQIPIGNLFHPRGRPEAASSPRRLHYKEAIRNRLRIAIIRSPRRIEHCEPLFRSRFTHKPDILLLASHILLGIIQALVLTMSCQPCPLENPSCGAASVTMPMRKTRSVDFFGRISARSSIHQKAFSSNGADAGTVASSFSRRAANDTYVAPQSQGLWNQCYKEGVPLSTVGYCLGTTLEQDDDWIPINPDSLLTESWKNTEAKSIPSVTAAPAAATGTTWKLGKLSVLMLLFVTFTDFALSQIQRSRSPEILPPLRYQSSGSRLGLGSAAISSVTEALSPILPFTGGVDLRREDYWTTQGSWFETLQYVAEQVQDAFSSDESTDSDLWNKIPRAGGNVPGKLASQLSSNKRIKTNNVSSISAQSPFIDVKAIEDLTLKDLTETFRYAVESSKEGFNEGRFMNGQLPRVKKVLIAMQEAVNKSRGKDVKDSVVSSDTFGEIDALKFSAAMRIFAEWRIVRQVPVGYKGYAVGMSLGHKDVVQNLAKIEQSVHSWLDHQREEISMQEQSQDDGESCPSELWSPTLRELLEHELETEVHPALPFLKDKTAAMGLLWVYRQFHYQTALFVNVLNVPKRFPSTKDAVSTAYQEVYDKYHGWAVQKIFSYSFQAAPEAAEIYKFMNPHRLKEVLKDAQRMKSSNSEDKADSLPLSTDIDNTANNDNPFVGFVKHVGGEWDKFTDSVGQVLKGEKVADVNVRGGGVVGLGGKELDEMVTREMIKDAHQHITEYLDTANPLLGSLSGLFDTFNMNDPTKV